MYKPTVFTIVSFLMLKSNGKRKKFRFQIYIYIYIHKQPCNPIATRHIYSCHTMEGCAVFFLFLYLNITASLKWCMHGQMKTLWQVVMGAFTIPSLSVVQNLDIWSVSLFAISTWPLWSIAMCWLWLNVCTPFSEWRCDTNHCMT